MTKIKSLVITILLINLGLCGMAQQTEIYQNPQRAFDDAVDLYERKMYASAQEMFGRVLEQPGLVIELHSEAAFYYAASSYFLENEDALEKLIRFTEGHAASRHLNETWFFIGNIHFSNKNYKETLKFYEKVEPSLLSTEYLPQYYFDFGYSLMLQDQFDQSIRYFDKIKTSDDNGFHDRAIFYKAYIYYQTERYQEALPLFTSLRNNAEFSGTTPLYILDMHHRMGDYQTVVKEGVSLFEAASKERQPQIAGVIADAFFKVGDYENAKKYFDIYKGKSAKRMTRTQNYQYGYIIFLNEQYADAIKLFSSVTTANDAITQSAYYHIALALLKTDKKKDAQRNFYLAYQMEFDPKIQEDALFNYAKLTYDLSYDPYKEAFKALKEYVEKYPNSKRVSEANQYIINLAVSTKNYVDALEALQQITNKTPEIAAAEQRLCYLYAVDFFTQKKYQNAIEWFEKAAQSAAIKEIAPESNYWIAEAYYRMNNFPAAKMQYQKFYNMKNASDLLYYKQVSYNMGYIAVNQGNYTDAQKEFQSFISQKGISSDLLNDAYVRLADCFYMNRSFQHASEYYAKAINGGSVNADYAVFQKAMCFGAQKQYQEKISELNNLIKNYSASLYHRDALYEIGITLLLLEKEQDALIYFDRIVKNYPKTNVALKSLLREGQVLYNMGRNEEALATLKQAVSSYPNTPQAKEALVIIKNMYLDMNKPDEYIAYASNIPFANVTSDEKETLLFSNAEQLYLEGKKMQAETALKSYLESYPQGIYNQMARFYYADCLFFAQKYDLALQEYEIVIETDKTENGKKATPIAAWIYYEKKDYVKALQRYNEALNSAETPQQEMTAAIGVMSCNEYMNDPKALKASSLRVLQIINLPEETIINAHLNIARASVVLKDDANAEREYTVVKNLASGAPVAEARFFLAQALYKKKQYDASIEAAFDLINDFPNENFWLVKSFLLLADNYIAKENTFQAEQTLNSIIENCQIPELKAEAQEKLSKISATK